jgi:hypothetical protein
MDDNSHCFAILCHCKNINGLLILECGVLPPPHCINSSGIDQHQVICVLTKSKFSIEYKPVAKCSKGPETFQKAIVDKNDTHFAHSARFCMPYGEQTRCSCIS